MSSLPRMAAAYSALPVDVVLVAHRLPMPRIVGSRWAAASTSAARAGPLPVGSCDPNLYDKCLAEAVNSYNGCREVVRLTCPTSCLPFILDPEETKKCMECPRVEVARCDKFYNQTVQSCYGANSLCPAGQQCYMDTNNPSISGKCCTPCLPPRVLDVASCHCDCAPCLPNRELNLFTCACECPGASCPPGQGRNRNCDCECLPGHVECGGSCLPRRLGPHILNASCQYECPPQACPPGKTVDPQSATCTCECPSGKSDCGGNCVDISVDPTNCGECGRQCQACEACINGKCEQNCGSCQACELGVCRNCNICEQCLSGHCSPIPYVQPCGGTPGHPASCCYPCDSCQGGQCKTTCTGCDKGGSCYSDSVGTPPKCHPACNEDFGYTCCVGSTPEILYCCSPGTNCCSTGCCAKP